MAKIFSINYIFLQKYTCKVNPSKESDVVLWQLHHFHENFESVIALHAKNSKITRNIP